MSRLVFFDLETAGLDPERHCVIQIAAAAVDRDDFALVEKFEVKIRFNAGNPQSCDPEALKLNSYDPEVWDEEAVPVKHAREDFSEFLRRHATHEMVSKRGTPYTVADVAGHNVASFDMPFLRALYAGEFLPAAFLTFDTLQLATWWRLSRRPNIKDLKLATLADYFDVDFEGEGAHDALADVLVNVKVAQCLLGTMGGG